MKILIVITGHRHNNEYKYFGQFLEKCAYLSSDNCEVFIHSNCPDNNIFQNTQYIKNAKRVFITDKNIGHNLGGIEAVGDMIDMLGLAGNPDCSYDYVIHVHPDVFIVDDQKLITILDNELHTDNVFIVNRSIPDDTCWYSFDFFVFKPKKMPVNIFRNYKGYTECPERFLYSAIISHEIPHIVIPRFDNNNWFPRRIDLNFMWHEHNLRLVDDYIREHILNEQPVRASRSLHIDNYVRNNRRIKMWF